MTPRRGLRLALLTTALLGVLCALPITPAQAADAKGRILQVSSADGKVSLLFSATGLGAQDSLDPNSVKVTLDGRLLQATATTATANPVKVKRTAVVAIDTSGSMAGARLAAAKSAARAFLGSLPQDVDAGLVTFSSKARVDVPPTADHARVQRAVSALVATGDTALYDAAALSARTVGTTGARTILLLSDGKDEGSTTPLASALDAVKASGALLSAVALGAEAGGNTALSQIASAAGGSVLKAPDAADLATAFQSAARSIDQQLVVTATLPASVGSQGRVVVTATAAGATVSDGVVTTLSGRASAPVAGDYGPKVVRTSGADWVTKPVLYGATAALFVGLLMILGLLALSGEQGRTGMPRRLSMYTLTGRAQQAKVREATVLGDSGLARAAVDVAGRVVQQRDIDSGLERRLDASGVPLRPAEWLLLHVGIAVGTAVLLFLISRADLLATIIGLGLGLLVPFVYLRVKEGRRTGAFLEQMPDTLQLVAGSLSAGYSLPQALDTVVREGAQPIAGEFNRALVESRLGVPIDEALDGIAHRMRSNDFSWVVMAIRIQRDVGGNLAEVLTTLAATLRERDRLRRQAKVLSAEGRLSAFILGGLPPVFFLYLLLVRRNYINPLFHDPIGVLMLVTGIVLMTVGGFWLAKVVKVEV